MAGIRAKISPKELDKLPITSIVPQTGSLQAKSSSAWLVPIITSAPEIPVLTAVPTF